jgi:hypothetical protein
MTRFNDILNGIKQAVNNVTKANDDVYPENEYQDDRLSLLSQDTPDQETTEEDDEEELMEYKKDFYEMSIGSIKSIMIHAQNILNALDQESVKENLTESWLQGKIALTEDYMITVHNFVMFGPSETDTEAAEKRPGLWDNIRKKRERMGKKYKPAKPGDKDRPDPDAWKQAQK